MPYGYLIIRKEKHYNLVVEQVSCMYNSLVISIWLPCLCDEATYIIYGRRQGDTWY